MKHAKEFEAKGIKPRDAIHLACSIKGNADYFLTCDDKLLRKAHIVDAETAIINPLDFIRMEVK